MKWIRPNGKPIGRNEPCPCRSGKKFKHCHLNKTETDMAPSGFTETVKEDTPRLVVMFKREGEQERFQWGMVGGMPLLSLIGCVARVQAELPMLEPGDTRYECPDSALVIAWDGKRFDWYVHKDIPVDSLVGMLETIKAALVGSNAARQQAAQQVGLVGPDGRPIRRM